MAKSRAEIFTDTDGEHRFRIVSGNNQIVATSEGYSRRRDAIRGLFALARIVLSITRFRRDRTVVAVDHTEVPG